MSDRTEMEIFLLLFFFNTSKSGIGIGDEKGLSFYLFGGLVYRGQGWLVIIRCVNLILQEL